MRLGRIGNTEIECSPLVLLPVLYALLAGRPGALLINLLALFLHELCHALTARAVGYRIRRIELQPFGFVARIEKRIGSRWDELAIAAAGPLFSLITGIACSGLSAAIVLNSAGYDLLAQFGRVNLLLGLINLVPALPLDGGRIAVCLLFASFPQRRALRALLLSGIMAGIAAVMCSFLVPMQNDISSLLLIMGLFLLLAAFREKRQQRETRLEGMLRRFELVHSGTALPVRFIALHADVEAQEALSFADLRGITYILVINDALEEVGRLSESQLLEGAAQLGMNATLCAILKLH